ncbi:YaeQ family protein [Thiorhodococcus mannitoliphagus]|uniref:YaeQ family protein n=1 Tax=Thiorhodococcus mannitoliphagus TaxID=329406 RepID=A0A6P1DZG6_9GAMM|nr:YaeQ family protein [Thiorhodococcus mannitoliphagus]NEX22411.1 YaeQ family protein [Thiorhodococcus mannitoliphagus]
MALKATVFKAQVQISDLDRHYYESHTLTLARHPSETDARMMVRLLAFCIFADPQLSLTKGLSTDEEPDLWQHSLSGEIERWIELGQPDERRLRQACGRAREVVVVTYAGRSAALWWTQNSANLARLRNLRVLDLDAAEVQALTALVARSMDLQCTLDGGQVWIGNDQSTVELTPTIRQAGGDR